MYDILEEEKDGTHFRVDVSCIVQSLKTRIINRPYDEITICFFNTVGFSRSEDADLLICLYGFVRQVYCR